MENALDMYDYIPTGVMAAFQGNGLTFIGCERALGMLTFDVEGSTRCGGDMVHQIELNQCDLDDPSLERFVYRAWWRAFRDVWEEFDPWTEAHARLDAAGRPTEAASQFDNGEQIYMDMLHYKEDVLDVVEDALYNIYLASRR